MLVLVPSCELSSSSTSNGQLVDTTTTADIVLKQQSSAPLSPSSTIAEMEGNWPKTVRPPVFHCGHPYSVQGGVVDLGQIFDKHLNCSGPLTLSVSLYLYFINVLKFTWTMKFQLWQVNPSVAFFFSYSCLFRLLHSVNRKSDPLFGECCLWKQIHRLLTDGIISSSSQTADTNLPDWDPLRGLSWWMSIARTPAMISSITHVPAAYKV